MDKKITKEELREYLTEFDVEDLEEIKKHLASLIVRKNIEKTDKELKELIQALINWCQTHNDYICLEDADGDVVEIHGSNIASNIYNGRVVLSND